LIVPKLRKVNEKSKVITYPDRAYYTTAGLAAVLGKHFMLASNGFQKRSPTTAAAPERGKHGKWISEAVGRYMTLSLKNFGYTYANNPRLLCPSTTL